MAKLSDATWAPMTTAPRDGSLVFVRIRASEQGAAEYDSVRWSISARSDEASWVATDSDPEARVTYDDTELAGWMPPPASPASPRAPLPPAIDTAEESDGSGM
jgi:hypothetical protein